MKKKEIKQRLEFINEYSKVDKFLIDLGFRSGHYWNDSSTPSDIYYDQYRKYIDGLYGIEHYIHDILKLSIRFIRDRNEHRIMFINGYISLSDSYDIEGFKKLVLDEVISIRDRKINELNLIKTIIK
jgi:hypothetical protein